MKFAHVFFFKYSHFSHFKIFLHDMLFISSLIWAVRIFTCLLTHLFSSFKLKFLSIFKLLIEKILVFDIIIWNFYQFSIHLFVYFSSYCLLTSFKIFINYFIFQIFKHSLKILKLISQLSNFCISIFRISTRISRQINLVFNQKIYTILFEFYFNLFNFFFNSIKCSFQISKYHIHDSNFRYSKNFTFLKRQIFTSLCRLFIAFWRLISNFSNYEFFVIFSLAFKAYFKFYKVRTNRVSKNSKFFSKSLSISHLRYFWNISIVIIKSFENIFLKIFIKVNILVILFFIATHNSQKLFQFDFLSTSCSNLYLSWKND